MPFGIESDTIAIVIIRVLCSSVVAFIIIACRIITVSWGEYHGAGGDYLVATTFLLLRANNDKNNNNNTL